MPTYDNEWIIRYVDGELNPDELGPFEAELASNPELAVSVTLYRELKTVLTERLPEDATRDALKERLEQLNKKHFDLVLSGKNAGTSTSGETDANIAPVRRMTPMRWLPIASVAACLLVAVVLLWPSDRTRQLQQLGQTEMIGVTERGSSTDTLLQQAAVLFNQKQFDKALPLLNKAVQADSTSQLPLFYRGIAAWHTGDLALARQSLRVVYESSSLLKNEAAFFMALTFASENKTAEAKEWIARIPETDAEYLKASDLQKILP